MLYMGYLLVFELPADLQEDGCTHLQSVIKYNKNKKM